MTEVVVDSSVILAVLRGEAGAAAASAALPGSLLSTVNLTEVVSKLAEQGATAAQISDTMSHIPCQPVDFDAAQAFIAGTLRPLTASRGLSLGDRACLALALSRNLPALTADRAWSELELGVDVRLIR